MELMLPDDGHPARGHILALVYTGVPTIQTGFCWIPAFESFWVKS